MLGVCPAAVDRGVCMRSVSARRPPASSALRAHPGVARPAPAAEFVIPAAYALRMRPRVHLPADAVARTCTYRDWHASTGSMVDPSSPHRSPRVRRCARRRGGRVARDRPRQSISQAGPAGRRRHGLRDHRRAGRGRRRAPAPSGRRAHCLDGRAGRLRLSGLRAVPRATGVRAPLRPRRSRRPSPVGRRSGRECRDVRARDLGAARVDLRLVDVDLDGARTVGGMAVGRQRAQPAGAVDRARGPRGAARARTRGTGEQGRRRGAAAHRPRAARHRGPLDERHRRAVRRGAPRDRHSAR